MLNDINDDRAGRRRMTGLGAALAACAALAAAGLAMPRAALAQGASARPCTEIESDSERLACYDRSLRPSQPASEPRAAARPSQPANEPRAAARASQPSNSPAVASPAAAAAREDDDDTNRREARRAARSTRAEAAAAAAAPPTAPGASRASQSDDEPEFVPIVVVNVRDIPGRNDKVFTTDSGVTWVQTDNARLDFPEPPFDAQIKPGMMGSYFLVTEFRNRAIRVRRQN